MGTTELIILLGVVVLVFVLIVIFSKNTEKINLEKQKQAEEKKQEENPTIEKAKTDRSSMTAEAKAVMEDVSNQAEDYIKSLMIKDDEERNKKAKEQENTNVVEAKLQQEEVIDSAEEEAAIILGIKKQSVHIIEDEDDNDDLFSDYKENTASILNSLDIGTGDNGVNTQISIDDFQEDSSVGEEFKTMSKKMKIMMVANVLGKKGDQDK